MFREVALPENARGRLFLHSMPGRNEQLKEAIQELYTVGINRIVSLAPLAEIQSKSPSYAQAIQEGSLPVPIAFCPIPDYGVPPNPNEFVASVREAVKYLLAGERLLLHCGAGIGGTGTYATAVLMQVGLTKEDALRRVRQAGSGPETSDQRSFLDLAEGG